ncbi:hypothetical protein ACFFIX_04695 [Metabacillus herbersteinensis]|uniref:DUF485 domain-containing protein n=1 Tax=Metabacillus herbersteinensis TaxID=283816 RepID=A0ABV6GAZ9_9BACI
MAGDFKEYDYVKASTIDVRDLEPLDSDTSTIMKSEFGTGFKLTLFYFAFIFTIPVLNWFAGGFMFSNFYGGMTFAWFLTGIVSMAMAFIIAFIHTTLYEMRIKKYDAKTSVSQPSNDRSVT